MPVTVNGPAIGQSGAVSGAGITDAQAKSASVQGSSIGELRKLSDGANKGVRVQWAVPAGATAAAWCWDIYPQAAYQG